MHEGERQRTGERRRAYVDYLSRRLEPPPAIEPLVARGIADPDRLGKMGWSAGGHMTNKIITFTDRFKAASSGAGAATGGSGQKLTTKTDKKGEFVQLLTESGMYRITATDAKIGMVQARWGHINQDYSLLTKIQSILLDALGLSRDL